MIEGACYVWGGGRSARGYGLVYITRRRIRYAHRYIWELVNGPIPKGALVLHDCDNPICMRPSHLHLGTHKQNSREAVERGRIQRGEQHHHAKLTEEVVRDMRRLLAIGVKKIDLARTYGVTPATMTRIAAGTGWSHL